MFTAHPTLLIGPSDWQPGHMPRNEFLQRLAALWQSAPEASHAIVYGDSHHHGELAYLTNLVPKLEATVALIARTGEATIFAGGGPNMLDAARPLTWIADVKALKDLGAALRTPMRCPLLIGASYMPVAMLQTITEAGGDATQDATPQLWAQMRRKSPHELVAVREACDGLRAAMDGIVEAQHEGRGVTDAVLTGEKAANACGAQDVRTLFSIDGGRTLRPFESLNETPADPLQVYVAARRFNYWVEGFASASQRPNPAASHAKELLLAALGSIKAGTRARDIDDMLTVRIKPFRRHPVTIRAWARSLGTALAEPPYTDLGEHFAADEIYSIAIGLTDDAQNHAIVSAMIAVRDDCNEVLWVQTR